MLDKLKSLSSKSKLAILSVALVLVALPLTLSLSQKQQNLTQNAASTCGHTEADYLRQEKTGTTTFEQCEPASGHAATDVASYHWQNYDCSQKYGVPASSMVAVQTAGQTFTNQFGFQVDNVSCVYTCATSEAVAAGERCVDGSSCPSGYNTATSGHVCNPGRVCCTVADNSTCQMGINQNCTTQGATQCTSNNAGVQQCEPSASAPHCLVWTTTTLCQNNTCVSSGGSASCKPSATCIEGSTRCISIASIPGGQPQICKNGQWTNPVGPCQAPLKCDQLTGTCRCFPGDSCNATPQPTSQPTAQPTDTPSPTPTVAPQAANIALVLGLDGIGNTGDTQNPNPVANSDPQYRSNPNPNHKTRSVDVTIVDSSGNSVDTGTGDVNYNSGSGKFEGTVALDNPISSGTYSILVKSSGYLRRKLATNINITSGNTVNVTGNLVAGDIDSDNQLSVLDYNIFFSCSVFSTDSGACDANGDYSTIADLTDDGVIDQNDYNLLTRELHNFQQGD